MQRPLFTTRRVEGYQGRSPTQAALILLALCALWTACGERSIPTGDASTGQEAGTVAPAEAGAPATVVATLQRCSQPGTAKPPPSPWNAQYLAGTWLHCSGPKLSQAPDYAGIEFEYGPAFYLLRLTAQGALERMSGSDSWGKWGVNPNTCCSAYLSFAAGGHETWQDVVLYDNPSKLLVTHAAGKTAYIRFH